MTAKFILQRQKQTEIFLIVFQLYHKEKIYNYGTGVSILQTEWNKEEQKVRKSRKTSFNDNSTLASYMSCFKAVYDSFGGNKASAKRITHEQLKEAIDKELIKRGLRDNRPRATKEQKTFFDYCEDFLKRDNHGKKKALSTIKQYEATFNILREYKPDAQIEDLNKSYLEGLKAFLFNKGYSTNGAYNLILRTKMILNFLNEDEILKDNTYKSFTFSKVETTQIALTIEEIDLLRNFQTDNEKHIIAKDLFLFQCLTGIRYSDLQTLQKQHFTIKNKINYLSFTNVKTSKKIEVPLFEGEAWQIANKYSFDFKNIALPIDKQDIFLKTIAEHVEINEMVEVISYPQGKKTIEFKPKYELIGTHTARRTFITIASTRGLTAIQIGQITGQRIETVTKYIKGNEASKENDMRKIYGG